MMSFKALSIAFISLFIFANAKAQSVSAEPETGEAVATTPATTTKTTEMPAAEAPGGPQHFEIIDGSSQITGDEGLLANAARKNWKKACEDWKKETKELNKGNQVMALNCGSAACATADGGSFTCTSTATYKVKVAGIRVPEAPAQAVAPPEQIVQQEPPPVIVEATPEPRPGFFWVGGYWGWMGGRNLWMPGHWIVNRPGYYWYGNQWVRRGPGWHFNSGHWGRH